MSELISVTDVEALDGYAIRVTFSDGAVKEIDFSDQLAQARGVFLPLRDPARFAEVRVNEESGTIEWPGEVDIDPEVLYGRFEPAAAPPMQRRTIREPVHV